jgi:hypothetical protein
MKPSSRRVPGARSDGAARWCPGRPYDWKRADRNFRLGHSARNGRAARATTATRLVVRLPASVSELSTHDAACRPREEGGLQIGAADFSVWLRTDLDDKREPVRPRSLAASSSPGMPLCGLDHRPTPRQCAKLTPASRSEQCQIFIPSTSESVSLSACALHTISCSWRGTAPIRM